MSGSPVYIDGKLLGAVSYSLGSFPKEPHRRHHADRGDDRRGRRTRARASPPRRSRSTWPATPDGGLRDARPARASARRAPLGALARRRRASSAPRRSPIWRRRCGRSARRWSSSGFDPAVDRDLRQALAIAGAPISRRAARADRRADAPLRPGDPVGMSLMRGDLEMGATGTVTHVDGNRVYAFGHPFLNLGPTAFAMTRAHVYTVLPSLDSSMKIATLGPVIGTMSQDRATAVGGTLGAAPRELEVNLTLTSDRARRAHVHVLRPPRSDR